MFIGAAIWGYSRVSEATAVFPQVHELAIQNKQDIAVLQSQQNDTAQQYADIKEQLLMMNKKLDHIEEAKADKDVTQQELQGFRR